MPGGFLKENDKLILKFRWKYEWPRIDKIILKRTKLDDFYNLITGLSLKLH